MADLLLFVLSIIRNGTIIPHDLSLFHRTTIAVSMLSKVEPLVLQVRAWATYAPAYTSMMQVIDLQTNCFCVDTDEILSMR